MSGLDPLWMEAWQAEEDGRRDEALAIMTRAAEQGSLAAARSLGDWLTEEGSDRREEGRDWLRRAAEAGDDSAAWNLAMEYRLDDDRDGYLNWLRRAAELGDDEAVAILAHIDRLQAEGRPWTMFNYVEVDRDTVWQLIDSYRDGEMDAEELNLWAIGVHERRSTIRLAAPVAPLARVVAELAAGEISLSRANELIFRLEAEMPESD